MTDAIILNEGLNKMFSKPQRNWVYITRLCILNSTSYITDGKVTLTLPQQLSGEEGGPGREKQKAKNSLDPAWFLKGYVPHSARAQGEL